MRRPTTANPTIAPTRIASAQSRHPLRRGRGNTSPEGFIRARDMRGKYCRAQRGGQAKTRDNRLTSLACCGARRLLPKGRDGSGRVGPMRFLLTAVAALLLAAMPAAAEPHAKHPPIVLPFEMSTSGHISFAVKVNGVSGRGFLDNGAFTSVIDK